jgi:hypothetical protein
MASAEGGVCRWVRACVLACGWMRVRTRARRSAFVRACVCVCACVRVYACVHIRTCARTCKCVCAYVRHTGPPVHAFIPEYKSDGMDSMVMSRSKHIVFEEVIEISRERGVILGKRFIDSLVPVGDMARVLAPSTVTLSTVFRLSHKHSIRVFFY